MVERLGSRRSRTLRSVCVVVCTSAIFILFYFQFLFFTHELDFSVGDFGAVSLSLCGSVCVHVRDCYFTFNFFFYSRSGFFGDFGAVSLKAALRLCAI